MSPPPPPIESWRLFFPLAAGLAVVGLGAWAAQLSGRPLGLLPADHGAFMLWGVLGTGVQGFLLTAYARQNDAPLPAARWVWAQLLLQLLGATSLLLRPAAPTLAILALLPWLTLLGWLGGVGGPSLRRRWDPTTAALPVAVAGGLVGLGLHLVGAAHPRGVDVGVHAFLVPTALAVLDRVLPFFSGRVTPGYAGVRRPGFLPGVLALAWLALVVPELARPAAVGSLLLLARQVHGWAPWPASRTPAIAVLHLGVAWFALAWAGVALDAPRSATLHAALVGGLGTLLLAVSMRVVQGHSGRPVALDRAGVWIVVVAQLAAAARVTAGAGGDARWLVPSGVLLATAFAGWLGWFVVTRRRVTAG